MKNKRKILVLFYSFTGGTAELAREVAAGAASIAGTEVMTKRVPELIPGDVFEKNQKLKEAKEKLEKEFPLASIEDLVEADAIAFGTPVHFGSFASQIKQFIDQLSPLWMQRKMVNKPAAVFCVSGSLHGGEEATLISLMIPLFNLGMIPVGIPYPIQGESPGFDAGSPYGAIFVKKSPEATMPEDDKRVAQILGRRLAAMAQVMKCGCDACNVCHELTKENIHGD